MRILFVHPASIIRKLLNHWLAPETDGPWQSRNQVDVNVFFQSGDWPMFAFLKTRVLMSAIAGLACVASPAPIFAVGGNGGHSFVIECTGSERLAAVMTNAGRRLEGIGVACVNQNGRWRQQWAGTSTTNASSHFRTFNIAPARWIRRANISIGKCGRDTTRVCGVGFVLDDDTAFDAGTRTDDTRLQPAPQNSEVFGFRGRAGREIDNLDALFRLRQRPAFAHSRRLRGQTIADAIDAALLADFRLRLNNITSRTGNSWHDENGSFLRMAGIERRFDIEEETFRRENGIRRYFYYVKDVNTRNAGIDFERRQGAFLMRILLEDDGVEMKGKCRRKRANGNYTACSGPHEGDGKAPDVHWSYPEIELTMMPQLVQRDNRRNGVGLRVDNVRLKGDFGLNGICGTLTSECHTILKGWKGRLITGVEAGVAASVNGGRIQRVMADTTRPILNSAGIPNLVDVVIDGDDVEFRW